MTTSLWRILLKAALETEESEISCEECANLLDLYADILVGEGNPDEIMPKIRQHLKHCSYCGDELEALIRLLQEAVKEKPIFPSDAE